MLLFYHLSGRFSHLEQRLLTCIRITGGAHEKIHVSTLSQTGIISLQRCGKNPGNVVGRTLAGRTGIVEKFPGALLKHKLRPGEETVVGSRSFWDAQIAKSMTINISPFIYKKTF